MFQQIGSAFGTAVLAIILSHGLNATGNTDIVSAFSQAFWWSAAFAAVSIVPVLFLAKNRNLRNG
jgi:hypothetical protein